MIEHGFIILVVAIIIGFVMAWAIGANDVANAMGISVGAKVLTLKQAILVAALFEALGAVLASGNVAGTISHGIIHLESLNDAPHLLVAGMIASLLSAGIWLLIASVKGWPVSTTHTIVGAIVGFGCICVGPDNIQWVSIASIMSSWVLTPLVSAWVSYQLFRLVQKTIFDNPKPAKQAKKTVPYYVFVVIAIMLSVVFLGGLSSLGIAMSRTNACVSVFFGAFLSALASYFMLKKIALHPAKRSLRDSYEMVEKIFGFLAIVTACAMAFAHGSNDVANAIAPLAAIVSIVHSGDAIIQHALMPWWILFLGAAGIVLGLLMYGYKVIATIGNNITDLTPTRGFVAQLTTASIVVLSSGFGIPVSTTHILVGSVLGVGLARGIDAINIKVVRSIFLSWFITFPVGMVLSMTFFSVIALFIR